MAGTKNSGNKYSIPINPDGELGEALEFIILPSGYGSATLLLKEFMEKHKSEMVDFWNKQGKDGNSVFEKWYAKWSMTKAQQKEIDNQKDKEAHDKLTKQYLLLGFSQQKADEHANAFPDKDPSEVVRIETYALQNADHHSKEKEPVVIPQEAIPIIEQLKGLGVTEKQIEVDGKFVYVMSMDNCVRLFAIEQHGSYEASKKAFRIPIESQQQPQQETQQLPHP